MCKYKNDGIVWLLDNNRMKITILVYYSELGAHNKVQFSKSTKNVVIY